MADTNIEQRPLYEIIIGRIENGENINDLLPSEASSNERLITGIKLFEQGTIYYDGKGTKPQDYRKARTYYEIAERLGNIDAICMLGIMHYYGEGVKKKNPQIAKIYLDRVDKSKESSLIFAELCYHGIIVPKNVEKAKKHLKNILTSSSQYILQHLKSNTEFIAMETIELYKAAKKVGKEGILELTRWILNVGHYALILSADETIKDLCKKGENGIVEAVQLCEKALVAKNITTWDRYGIVKAFELCEIAIKTGNQTTEDISIWISKIISSTLKYIETDMELPDDEEYLSVAEAFKLFEALQAIGEYKPDDIVKSLLTKISNAFKLLGDMSLWERSKVKLTENSSDEEYDAAVSHTGDALKLYRAALVVAPNYEADEVIASLLKGTIKPSPITKQ